MSQVIYADVCEDHARTRPLSILPKAPRAKTRGGIHFENVALREGVIGRLRCAPQTALSLPAELAGASTQGVFVLYVLAGDVDVSHAGHRSVARGGDIVTFDGTMPTGIAMSGQGQHDIVTLEGPAARLSRLRPMQGACGALRLIRDASASPLAGCMRLMADQMPTASKEELAALHEACISLLATSERRLDAVATPESGATVDNPLLRSILDYTNRNISDGALSPPDVANTFGISVRYLHKLFAASGVTFGAYVAMRRLDYVRSELISGSGEAQSIAALAQKWGFRDVSTFNRAFRKRFGCAPRRLRQRVAS